MLPARRVVLVAGAAWAASVLAGCVSLTGGDSSVPVWYRLEDGSWSGAGSAGAGAVAPARAVAGDAPAPAVAAALARSVLLVGPVVAPGFYDSAMVAYSRVPGAFAHYQFAGWSERPGRRIATLVESRLASRGRFAAVAQSTAGVRGDLLLNLSIEHLYHDATVSPGTARVALSAELVDWRARRLLGRRAFDHRAPVAREAADAAVAAIGQALGSALDALGPGVERTAAGGAVAS